MSEPIREEELHAYVDGALAPERRQQVETFLRENPEKAAEVGAWQRQNETLAALFDTVTTEPVPERLKPQAIRRRLGSPFAGLARIAAALLLFAAGGAFGWFGRDIAGGPTSVHTAAARPVVSEAVAAYAVYASEVLHPVEVTAADEPHLVKWLSKRLATPVKAPKLAALGYSLVGGRLLPGPNGAAAQFMYENQVGKRIALYLAPSPDEKASAFQFASLQGYSSFYWLDNRVSYALVGDLSREALTPLAHEIYRQLNA